MLQPQTRAGTRRARTPFALAALLGTLALSASPAGAASPDRAEQFRYAKETMAMSADAFAARKADFVGQGCWTGPTGCNKPAPYNAFDWSDDGCSWTPPHLASRFRKACLQHDFGYRNFGKGLQLGRTERNRAAIDLKFRKEMYAICDRTFRKLPRKVCRSEAYSMWGVVRHFNDWRD